MKGQTTQQAKAVEATLGGRGADADDDDDDEIVPASKPATKTKAPASAPDAPEDPATTDPADELAERLARAEGGDKRPSFKDEMKAKVMALGVPEGLAAKLVNHGKASEIQAWIQAGIGVPSQADTARQPSAPPAATPDPAPTVAPQESGLREALAGVRSALDSAGVFEKSESESLAGFLERVVERQDRLERSMAEAQDASRKSTHDATRARYEAEIKAAKEGLAEAFPQVLDQTVYRDRIAPIFEALATSQSTASRSLRDNLAAACRAAQEEESDADMADRTLQTTEAARRAPTAPRTRAASAAKITQAEFSAGIVALRMAGAGADARDDYVERWKGRVIP
jgi:hypothetical protein